MKYLTLLVVTGCIISLILFNRSQQTIVPVSQNNLQVIPTTPTPYPLREMTIPHLQERTYTGTIGEKILSYRTPTYTAYLTSYSSDGLRINGLLTEPTETTPENGWPAIVFIHGYIPPTQYKTTQQYYDYVDYLARNGFVVFKIDLRGHGSSEGEATGAYYSADYVIDTLNAYESLKQLETVNPNRIGVWGHSMAGNIVLRSIVTHQTIPAAVIWAGAVYTYQDMIDYGIQDSSFQPPSSNSQWQQRRQRLRDLYGTFNPEIQFWREIAPTNYLQDIKTSIQLHHAKKDAVVSIEYSRNLQKLLNTALVTNELYEYDSGGHNLNGQAFTQAMQRTVKFFKAKL